MRGIFARQRDPANPSPMISLSIISLLALACPAFLAGCTAGAPDVQGTTAEAARDAGYSATDAEIIQTGADGEPRYRLQAASIEQDPRTLEIALRNVRFETRDAQAARWQLSAATGSLSRNAERLRLEGGVQLEGGDARDADRLRVVTQMLDYDLQGAKARAAGKVSVTLHGHILEAKGLDANLRTRQVRLNSDVHGRFTP